MYSPYSLITHFLLRCIWRKREIDFSCKFAKTLVSQKFFTYWKHESLVNNFLTSQTCWTSWIWWTSVLHVWYLTMRNSNIGNIIQVRIVSICFSFKFYKSKQLGKGTWYIYYHFSCLKNSSCQLSATSAKNFMNVKIMLLRKHILTHCLMNTSTSTFPIRVCVSVSGCLMTYLEKLPFGVLLKDEVVVIIILADVPSHI